MATPARTPAERVLLRKVRLFTTFDDEACDRTLDVLQRRACESGTEVFRQGSQGDTMIVLVDGMLRVDVSDVHGQRATVATIRPGEVVGEMAVLDPAPRSASVWAATECQLLELDRAGLDRLQRTCPSASAAIVGTIIGDVTRRLRHANRRIDTELGTTPKVRAARAQEAEAEEPGLFSRLLKRLGR